MIFMITKLLKIFAVALIISFAGFLSLFPPAKVSASAYPVDAYIDFESGTDGSLMTVSDMGAGSHGISSSWIQSNGASHMYISNTGQHTLGGPVQVGATTYTDTGGTRGFKFDPEGTTDNFFYAFVFPEPFATNVSFGSYFMSTSNTNDGLSIVEGITGPGDYVVTHWTGSGGSGFGNPALHIKSGDTGAISITPGVWYYVTGVYRTGGLDELYVFDATTGLLVGNTSVANVGSAPISFSIGRGGTDFTTGVGQWYWDNVILSYSGIFPLIPFTPKVSTTTYDHGSGTYNNSVVVTVSNTIPSSLILYCTDTNGTCTPNISYTSPVSINVSGTHLRTLATRSGWTNSDVTDATYTINSWRGPTYVQSCSSLSYNTSSVSCTLPANVVAGNALAVYTGWESVAFTSITDTCGTSGGASNTYTVKSSTASYSKGAIAYALSGYGKSCTITATYSAATGGEREIIVHEITNVNQTTPVVSNQHAITYRATPGSGTDAITSGNITTTQSNTYIFGAISGLEALGFSVGTGFTAKESRVNWSGTGYSLKSEELSKTTAGTIAATFTSAGATYYNPGIIAFQHPDTYYIGGNVSGLTGTVVLQNNAGDNLSISSNGGFTFSTMLANSASYNVTVSSQPTGQTCTVGSGTGTVSSADITNISVNCTTNATDITTAGVTGFTAPATLGTPQVFGNLTAGSAQYTVTGLTWSPTDNPYHATTAYTATVVLTSAATYKFPTGGIAVPTANGGGTVSAGTTSGGDVSGNTLTFTVLFPSTAAKTTPTLSVTNSPVTYNASSQAVTVSSGGVAGVVSNILYSGSGTVPTTAGTYAITADFAPTDSADYNSLTGASAGNFVINLANQGTLTAISTPSTVPYGTTATLSSSGGSGTGAVTFSVGASTGCNITGGTTLNVSDVSGTCTVTATKAADTNYNSATSAGLSVTLTKGTQATLTVTGLPASAVYLQAGITAGTSGGSGTGAVTFSAGASTACSINSGTGAVSITAASGSCLITATKATDSNYNSATSGTVSIAVGTAPQTITVNTPAPASATYNGTFPVAATASSGLTVAITTTGGCTISGGTVTMTSGTTACTVNYNQAGNGSYSAASQVQSVTTATLATQSSLTAISTPSTVAYGTTATLSSSGGSGTGAVTFSAGASTGCNITGGTTLNVSNASGTCTVTATKAADTNYNSATSAGLSVTLTKATQSALTFTGQAVTSPTTFSTLSTTGGLGTGAVSYAVTTAGTAGCSITGTTLSYTSVGTCGVTATKATDSNYNSISSSEATFTINAPTAHTITVTSGSNGTITPGTTSVNNGSDQSFIITPNSGYHIDTVTADSVAVSATSPYTFTNVTADHTISATFAVDSAPAVTGGGPLVSGGNGAPVGLINGSGSRRQDISSLLATTTTTIPGCKNGTNGFSITTGQSCSGNTGGITTTIPSTLPKYNFTRNLSLHATGKDVKALQQYLNTNGFVISKTGAGSLGKETTLFGTLTYKALVKFQKSLGWSGTGFFGPLTRSYVNTH